MARRHPGQGRFSRRQKTWMGIIAATAIVFALLYWEQIAFLYLLATLALTALLFVVAVSDLGESQTAGAALAPADTVALNTADVPPVEAPKSTFGGRKRKNRK